MTKIKTPDIVVGVLFILLAMALLYVNATLRTSVGERVEVSFEGKVIKVLPLNEDTIYRIDHDGHINVVEIREGKCYMKEANCRDQLCVNSRPIKITGETIICLPHRISLRVVGGEGEVDAFSR
ncbi:NusG domain II-containing protein [Guggenheimella bovis]